MKLIVLWLCFMAYALFDPISIQSFSTADWFRFSGFESSIRDWVENFLLAFPLGILVGLSKRNRIRSTFLLALLVALPFEILQCWMPTRYGSVFDVLAMLAGSVSGALITFLKFKISNGIFYK